MEIAPFRSFLVFTFWGLRFYSTSGSESNVPGFSSGSGFFAMSVRTSGNASESDR